ncbi:MAG: hypothetical protein VXW91_06385, partial [Pseudomonadota bacterium]|nr:hypothetical protein [Pseudomonadota bacterium]
KNLEKCARNKEAFAKEKANAAFAMENGHPYTDKPANLSDPAHQLLWAATILYANKDLSANLTTWSDYPMNKGIGDTRLWLALESSPYAIETLTKNAGAVMEELRQPGLKFGWGGWQSGFAYDRREGEVTFDFLQSLIMGLEHANAELFRQMGYARYSVSYPDKNKELREKILTLKKREEDWGGLSAKDYKALRKASLEWEMRTRFWETAEKMVAGAFAVERGMTTGQDYGYSLNHNMMTIKPFGGIALDRLQGKGAMADQQEAAEEQMRAELEDKIKQLQELLDDPDSEVPGEIRQLANQQLSQLKGALKQIGDTPEKRFVNVLRAVELSFYRNNGLFDDTPDGWKLMGVDPKKVVKRPDEDGKAPTLSEIFAKGSGGRKLPEDFRQLMAMCGPDGGLQSLLPKAKDRWFGKAYYDGLISKLSRSRNELIEQMWDLYVEPLAQEILQNLEEELDE